MANNQREQFQAAPDLVVSTDPLVILLDGKRATLDPADVTEITDIDEDMKRVPGDISWYHQLLAAAEANVEAADAQYRAWRAEQVTYILADDPKAAEWKVKSAVDNLPEFTQHKANISRANALATRLRGVVVALRIKADMLRSLGARERDELSNTSVTTRDREADSLPSLGRDGLKRDPDNED